MAIPCFNVPCCSFCMGFSLVAMVFLLVMAHLVKIDYKFLGEWYKSGEPPSSQDIEESSGKAVKIAMVYLAFFVFSTVCTISLSIYKGRGAISRVRIPRPRPARRPGFDRID